MRSDLGFLGGLAQDGQEKTGQAHAVIVLRMTNRTQSSRIGTAKTSATSRGGADGVFSLRRVLSADDNRKKLDYQYSSYRGAAA
jgi:hypothetical protein